MAGGGGRTPSRPIPLAHFALANEARGHRPAGAPASRLRRGSPFGSGQVPKRSLVPLARGVNLHNAMPVAAATAQAQSDARGEAKAFAKENAGGFQPSSHGLTTLMLALFAIMTDITDDFGVPALLLLNHVTTKVPLASILRNSRYRLRLRSSSGGAR